MSQFEVDGSCIKTGLRSITNIRGLEVSIKADELNTKDMADSTDVDYTELWEDTCPNY